MNNMGKAVNHHCTMGMHHSLGASSGTTGIHYERHLIWGHSLPLEGVMITTEQAIPGRMQAHHTITDIIDLNSVSQISIDQFSLI